MKATSSSCDDKCGEAENAQLPSADWDLLVMFIICCFASRDICKGRTVEGGGEGCQRRKGEVAGGEEQPGGAAGARVEKGVEGRCGQRVGHQSGRLFPFRITLRVEL